MGRTIIIKDLDDAIKLAKRFNYAYRIVTLNGDIINAGGSMTGGSLSKGSTNLLNRKYRIEKIEEDINELQQVLSNLEEDKRQLKTEVQDIQSRISIQEENLQKMNIEIIRIDNEKIKFIENWREPKNPY